MKKLQLLILTACCLGEFASSQSGSTGIGTTTPHASSILDISSNNKGVLLPRVSSTQRKAITNPAGGLMVYDTDKRTIFLYDGAQWLPMMTASSSTAIPPETAGPDDVDDNDGFGISVGVSGNYAIVGTLYEDDHHGSAYIYFRSGGVWTQQAKLTATDGAEDDFFGASVAISGDYAVVGAYGDDILTSNPPFILNHPDRGSIYIFQRNGTVWTQQAKFTSTIAASDLWYGYSVAMDGNRIVVGALADNESGTAYVYQRSGSLWILQQRIIPADGLVGDVYGSSVDISGNYLIVGAPGDDYNAKTNLGSAYIYFHNGISWTLQEKLEYPFIKNNDNAGESVAINDSIVLVGCPAATYNGISQGAVFTARRSGTVWNGLGTIYVPDGIEAGLTGQKVSVYGQYALIAAPAGIGNFPGYGTCYLYKLVGNYWILQQKINHPSPLNTRFGSSVAIDGFHLVIGALYASQVNGGVAFLNIE